MFNWLRRKCVSNPILENEALVNGHRWYYYKSIDTLFSEYSSLPVTKYLIKSWEARIEEDKLILDAMKLVLKDRKKLFKES